VAKGTTMNGDCDYGKDNNGDFDLKQHLADLRRTGTPSIVRAIVLLFVLLGVVGLLYVVVTGLIS
jgi:hypothetical protein